MDKEKSMILPPSESLTETVDNFNNFFQQKVENIRENITKDRSEYFSTNNSDFSGEKLCVFAPATIEEIAKILKDTQFKSSSVFLSL